MHKFVMGKLAGQGSLAESTVGQVKTRMDALLQEARAGYHQLLGEALEKHQKFVSVQQQMDQLSPMIDQVESKAKATNFVKAENVDAAAKSINAHTDSIGTGPIPTS